MSASRWQPAPVLIWTTGAPVPRIFSASIRVSWSPSMTATGRVRASSVMVRRSSDVLPDPGELIRFSATMPRSASQARLCAGQVVVLGEQGGLDLHDARARLVPVPCALPVRGPPLSLHPDVGLPQPQVPHMPAPSARRSGQHDRRDRQFPAGEHLDVGAAAAAQQDRVGEREVLAAGAAAPAPAGWSNSSAAPSSGVPAVTSSKQKRIASGTTPASRPTRSRTLATGALPVRSVTASTTLWVIATPQPQVPHMS